MFHTMCRWHQLVVAKSSCAIYSGDLFKFKDWTALVMNEVCHVQAVSQLRRGEWAVVYSRSELEFVQEMQWVR